MIQDVHSVLKVEGWLAGRSNAGGLYLDRCWQTSRYHICVESGTHGWENGRSESLDGLNSRACQLISNTRDYPSDSLDEKACLLSLMGYSVGYRF